MIGAVDYTLPVEAVAAAERSHRPLPLRAADRRELFGEWVRLNPGALAEMEAAALEIAARGMRVSAKYLIERQRYEGTARATAVPFEGPGGARRAYAVNNSDSSLLARWLRSRHPGMRVELRRSMFDGEEGSDGGGE